ncbi:MAG: hypothetical protein GY809_09200 [Planctomycetes bacterium]|nr:hypothetical protein [Planctomycetota bacterium]
MTFVPVDASLTHLATRVRVVRQWLLTLKCLHAASVALAGLAVAVVACWGLSWYWAWQVAGHCLCGALLLCCTAAAILWVEHARAESVTYSEAGAAIETRQTLHRQLVTAMEYYEDQAHFPYSRSLTHHMIRRVSQRSKVRDFGDCVPRRQVWLYSVIIGLEILILGGFLVSESAFWYGHWTQSVQAAGPGQTPGSGAQDPNGLTPVTQDILTEPNTLVTFEAQSGLEDAESVRFVMQRKDPNGGPGETVVSREVPGVSDPETGGQKFSTQQFCESPDQYQYRFESKTEATPWSDLTVSPRPQVQSVMSRVQPPHNSSPDAGWHPVEHGSVDVVQGSDVALRIQTDQPLSQVQVRQDGKLIETLTPSGSEAVYQCQPDKSQSLTFTPVNTQGQPVAKPFYVELEVKVDQKPHIELLVPEGDVPLIEPVPVRVTFKISDDVGLASAALYYEVKNRPAKCLKMPVADQSKEVELSRTLALDKWRLVEGDTVMFYCEATDVPLDPCAVAQEAHSEIHFIEIQREIKIKDPQESNMPGFAETLLDALEYIRAIMKKTWTLSHVKDMTPLHLESGQALVKDLAHTQAVIEKNRDDPDMNFSDQDKAVLSRVIEALSDAEQSLNLSQASDAVVAEKKGYRILRDFIKEDDRTPVQAPPSPKPEVPEKIKVQSNPESPPMSEQEAKAELQNIQKQLESLTRQQKQLKKALDETLASREDTPQMHEEPSPGSDATGTPMSQGPSAQNSSSPGSQASESGQGGSQSRDASASSQPSSGQGQSDSPGQGQDASASEGQGQSSSAQGQSDQGEGQGQSGQSSSGQGQGQSGQGQSGEGQGQGQSGGSGPGSGTGSSQGSVSDASGSGPSQSRGTASQAARLSMLEAKQKALQSMAGQIEEALDRVTEAASGIERQASQDASDHLKEASRAMDRVESELAQLQQGADQAEESTHTMSRDALNQILDQLNLAETAMDDSLLDSALDKQIKQAQRMTDELMSDVEAMTQAPQEVDAEAMKARLKNAERLLDNLVQARSTVVQKTQRGQGLPSALSKTDYQVTSPSQAARQMVQRLWTAVMALSQEEGRALDVPASVSQFWESENAFFERASRYQAEGVE